MSERVFSITWSRKMGTKKGLSLIFYFFFSYDINYINYMYKFNLKSHYWRQKMKAKKQDCNRKILNLGFSPLTLWPPYKGSRVFRIQLLCEKLQIMVWQRFSESEAFCVWYWGVVSQEQLVLPLSRFLSNCLNFHSVGSRSFNHHTRGTQLPARKMTLNLIFEFSSNGNPG